MAGKKATLVDKQTIISRYMDYVLEYETYPKSVYKFCKEIKIKEEEFYKFFGSIEKLKTSIWSEFYNNATGVMYANKEYDSYSNREKMLTFFYTFFELLTMNRSFVLFDLKEDTEGFKNLQKLGDLRKDVRSFATKLIEEENQDKQLRIMKRPVFLFAEGAWIQTVFLLKFWLDDDSAEFEKTDMAIEKSVNTIFDVFDNTPLESVVDFGKFLWKENSFWN